MLKIKYFSNAMQRLSRIIVITDLKTILVNKEGNANELFAQHFCYTQHIRFVVVFCHYL
jgi:hypothetical protein